MERAFKFLKRTSVSCGAPGAGVGVTLEDKGGVVFTGEALGDAPPTGDTLGGVSSWASRVDTAQIETNNMQNRYKPFMLCSVRDAEIFAMSEMRVW